MNWMRQEKTLTRPSARSGVSARLSRQFPFVLIMLAALSLASCRTAKTAQVEMKRQASTEIQSGISLEMTSQEADPVEESPVLTLSASDVESLPEGAEYSRQEGQTRVSVRKKRGDTLDIRATSLRDRKQNVKVTAEVSGRMTSADSTHSEASAKAHWDQPQARGQPGNGDGYAIQLLFAFLALTVCWMLTRKKSD